MFCFPLYDDVPQRIPVNHDDEEVNVLAVDLARRFIYKALVSTADEMYDYEGVAAVMSAMTEDAREGTQSFIEKRRPKYSGR